MIDNLAKVYLNENGSIKDFEDTAFLVSNADKANAIQFYVPDSMNTSLIQLSFKRADGFVISNRQMEFITVLDPASGADVEVLTKLYEYQFTEADRILDIAGQLQVSALLKDGNKTIATPYFCLYIRRNIQPNLETKTEEEFYQEGLAIVEQAQIDINNHRADFNNPHRVRGDQVSISKDNQTLISDKFDDINQSINLNNTNISNLQQKDFELEQEIEQNANEAKDYTDKNTFQLQRNINILFSEVQNLNGNKLNKIFNDIAIANNLAENDYFVLNSGNQVYRITVENIKKLFGGGGSDHYKGDFISYEELVETYPTAKAGDYAFVNIGSQMIMYVWDYSGVDETMQGLWRETTSGKYVLTTTFANFQEMLLNGSLIVDTAKNFDNGDGTKTNIKQTVDAFTTKIKEYALAESLNIRTSNMNLIIGLSNEDSLIEKSIDLSPLIQTVVDENDVYIVNYDDVTTDSKVLNFLKNNQPEKIVVIDSNSTKKRYMCFVGMQQSTDFTDYKYQVILIKDDTLLINANDPILYTKYGVTIRFYDNGTISKFNGNYTFRYSPDTFTITYQGFTINPATDEEITTGTNDVKAITPKGLKTYMDGLSFGYVVPTVYITNASLESGTFSGDDLTNLQNDPNTIIYQANEDSTNDAYTILGETAGTRTFGNFKGNIVYKIEVNLADGTWLKTNVDIVTQSEFNSTIGDINSILDAINGEVI